MNEPEAEHCAAAPRHRWQIGRYRLEYDSGRWGLSDRCKGVGNCRTPLGAWLALRRWQRVKTEPVE
jgi:hypothetical protein